MNKKKNILLLSFVYIANGYGMDNDSRNLTTKQKALLQELDKIQYLNFPAEANRDLYYFMQSNTEFFGKFSFDEMQHIKENFGLRRKLVQEMIETHGGKCLQCIKIFQNPKSNFFDWDGIKGWRIKETHKHIS